MNRRGISILRAFQMANRLVTNAEYLSFIADGGYDRAELWLSDGWRPASFAVDRALYWEGDNGQWSQVRLPVSGCFSRRNRSVT